MARGNLRSAALFSAALLGCGTMLGGTALVSGSAAGALAAPSTSTSAADLSSSAPAVSGRPGTDLLVNPGAQAGDASKRGWDALTIPGWQIVSGLPTVVRYGTGHFPAATGRGPAVKTGQMFVGGAGGTAKLRQVVPLLSMQGTGPPKRTSFRLSGFLGGDSRSSAGVSVTFLSAAGRALGHASIRPVSGHLPTTASMAFRARTGKLPAGTVRASVVLTLATKRTNIDGFNAPYVGFDRGVADDASFSVSTVVRPRTLTQPAVKVPRYQHVFLFYFENEGYGDVVGNTRQAPYLNSLLPHASVLTSFFAEEHPSDANYLALAGGSAFGVPLTDPLEENSQYTIRAPNISDLLDAAHENWKAYLQSAAGPCDATVHRNYWDDDQPMMYFADVRDRPAYCSAHVVPLDALQTDLASAATTPSFNWVSPDDCSDMEGCGIRAGDNFLKAELSAIMQSPAWRTQRSLAIITVDEDGYNHEHPAQRVATLVLGSAGVRQGYVSPVRYTHYSLLRTIEGSLGLGTLTKNDAYAKPVNDVFVPGQGQAEPAAASSAGPVAGGGAAPAVGSGAAPVAASSASRSAAGAGSVTSPARPASGRPLPASASAPRQQTAFVVNSASNSVTPVNLVTHKAGKAIPVGKGPTAIALAPGGGEAYVVNSGSGTATPIATASRRAGSPIPVGSHPQGIAITPDGRTAFVTNTGSDSVTPISLRTGQAGVPIPVGHEPQAISITPDGRTAFALDWGGSAVTPINVASERPGRAVRVGSYPYAISMAPNGSTAYVANYGSDTVTPIDVATGLAGRPISAGQAPNSLAVTPDCKTVLVTGGDSDTVTPISVGASAGTPAGPGGGLGAGIRVGYSPESVAIAPSGATAFVVNTVSGTVTPINVATGTAAKSFSVGVYSYPTLIDLAPAGSLGVVVDTYGDQVTLVNTSSRKSIARINVGNYPDAVAIAP